MGAWGAKLYDDDAARDLKESLALLAKLPASGDRLLEIALQSHGATVALDDDGGPTFWLVMADQFERRGIRSETVFARALEAIDSGADQRDLAARGMDAKGLEARRKVLAELGPRLLAPRPERRLAKNPKPPAFNLEVGDVFAYPTKGGKAFNAWLPASAQAGFVPDGWGAMLVVALGRAYDWLPWCAVASLVVDPAHKPTLEQAARSRLVSTRGARYCVPMKTHLQRMRMEFLGRVPLDPAKGARAISDECAPEYAVANGWSFVSVLSVGPPQGSGGLRVTDLA